MAATKSYFDIAKSYSAKFLLILVFFLQQYHSFALPPVATAAVFKNVIFTPQKNRVTLATSIYKANFRHVDQAKAMDALDQLNNIAQNLGDKSLQCAVFDMRADYYSVNRGFNNLSTAYYENAVSFAKTNDMFFEQGLYLYNIGVYYFVFGRNTLACQYFLRAQEIFTQVGYRNIPDISIYLSEIASFYYGLGDYETAKQDLETALPYIADGRREKVNIINTIGLIYRNNKQWPEALTRFNQALNMAIASKDSAWVGIAKGNIGSVYFLQGQYKKAMPYIQTDYTVSLKYDEPVNAAIALLRLVKINIDDENYGLAGQQLNQVSLLITNTKENVLGLWADYYDQESQLFEQQGNAVQAIAFRKIFELYKDSLVKRNNIAAVERVKLQWETDKRITQLSNFKAHEKIRWVESGAAVAVLLLLAVISLLVYNRQRLKSKKDKELLLAEKRIVDEELKNAVASLHLFTENLLQKNVLIENFKGEVDKLSKQSINKTDAAHLEKLLQAHIMTDDNWNDFKKLFSKVYPGFFVKMNKNYAHLSSIDIRILTLVKLGLNNTEMANMLGITVEGIKKAKQRLRKKTGVEMLGDI